MGRGSRGRGRGRGSNGPSLDYDFEISELKDDGTPSTFEGAIENLTGTFTEADFGRQDYRTVTFPSQTRDLKVSLGQNTNISNETFDSIEYKIEPTKYEYTDTAGDFRSGTVELNLSIFDDIKEEPGFQIITSYGEDGKPATTKTVDTDKATNSVEYIISEGLFGYVDKASVVGADGDKDRLTGQVYLFDGNASFTPIDSPEDPDPEDPDPEVPGTNGDDVLTGDDGDNILSGDGGNDTLTGGDGNDFLFGGDGDDLLNGGNGDDILDGGAGRDVLVGNGGTDIFVISISDGDVLQDFDYSQDLISLSDGVTFEDLDFSQNNGTTILSYQDQAIASISGGTPGQINECLFTTI
jgi:RTX calcium-binding nonapeptide repeat (4 copies)